jgi:hypothetical protein
VATEWGSDEEVCADCVAGISGRSCAEFYRCCRISKLSTGHAGLALLSTLVRAAEAQTRRTRGIRVSELTTGSTLPRREESRGNRGLPDSSLSHAFSGRQASFFLWWQRTASQEVGYFRICQQVSFVRYSQRTSRTFCFSRTFDFGWLLRMKSWTRRAAN